MRSIYRKSLLILIRWKVLIYANFTACCLDVLSDKPHPQFGRKILSKKYCLFASAYGILFSKFYISIK